MTAGADRVPRRGLLGVQRVWTLARSLSFLRPPLANPRFWATQALVVAIAAAHDSIEALGILPRLGMAYFLPMSLFFIPVVYSALYFGLSGAVATALWCTLISTPNWVLWHNGSERYGVVAQMLIVDAIAIFVGSRVDQQMKARADAEAASDALQVSETKYRGLFETAGEGVLVLDKNARIVECNAAAGALLRTPREILCGRPMGDVLPPEVALALSSASVRPSSAPVDFLIEGAGGGVWIEPVCTPFAEQDGLTQVVLRNVTEQMRRQAGLETYTAQILRAQEEERKRVAQELHDETVQSLVVLCRKLDDSFIDNPPPAGSLTNLLREAHAYAESLVESVRGIARGLRPPILDDLGLTPAIDRLLAELTARSEIDGRLAVSGSDRRLSPDVELALFRICQEALHNVERHSCASLVRVNLNYEPQRIQLVVADNGKGMPPATLDDRANESKLGLMGMQERARAAGGKLTIRSTPGAGTKVIVEAPHSAPA